MVEKINRTSPERAPSASSTREAPPKAACSSKFGVVRGHVVGASQSTAPVTAAQVPSAMRSGLWKKAREGTTRLPEVQADKLTFDALFKRYELAQAFSLNSETVRADALRVQRRLKEGNRLLVDPEAKYMQMWDGATILALLFTLVVSPYEIGFMSDLAKDNVSVIALSPRSSTEVAAMLAVHGWARDENATLQIYRMAQVHYIGVNAAVFRPQPLLRQIAAQAKRVLKRNPDTQCWAANRDKCAARLRREHPSGTTLIHRMCECTRACTCPRPLQLRPLET